MSPPPTRERRSKLILLGLFCGAAFVARVASAIVLPNIANPDEIYQTLEQAHRLVYGYGIVPWEFVVHERSWILPGGLAGIFKLSDQVLRVPEAPWLGAVMFLSAISVIPVVCAFAWASQHGGSRAAVLAAGFTAFWFELVYFGPKALSEVVAGNLLVAALWLGFPGAAVPSRLRLLGAGVTLGLAFAIRIQLAPVLVVIAGYCYLIRKRQSWHYLALGFAALLTATGALDWLTLGAPWQSIWKYFDIQLLKGKAAEFGTEPPYFYVARFAAFWSVALPPMVGLIWLGAKRLPLLGVIAVVVLVSHSAIAHKEYRFVYPAIVLLVILAGLGSSELVVRLKLSQRAAWAYLGSVSFISGALALQRSFRPQLTESQGEFRATRAISIDPTVCGIILWRDDWWRVPGYTVLHRDIPIYQARWPIAALERLAASGNTLLTRSKLDDRFGFTLVGTFGHGVEAYLYHREGPCSRALLGERLIYP
jgi:hypothetical protein